MILEPSSGLARALKDLFSGFASYHIWLTLGWQEIRLRYRRSVLGPLWLTISTGALIGGMGPLYGSLFGQDLASYFPHLAVSFIVWILIANLINESCVVFTSAESMIKQIRLPFTLHVLRTVWKNVIIFLHHIIIIIIVLLFYPPALDWQVLLVPAGILALAVNGVWLGLVLGMLCARFRDVPQIVQSVVQVMFFLTPVIWRPESLGRLRWASDWNPLNHMLEILRAPLTGKALPLHSWAAVGLTTLAGFALALAMFARYRSRIAYWV
jgi:homopolymeric O-antigen transport system permease protein